MKQFIQNPISGVKCKSAILQSELTNSVYRMTMNKKNDETLDSKKSLNKILKKYKILKSNILGNRHIYVIFVFFGGGIIFAGAGYFFKYYFEWMLFLSGIYIALGILYIVSQYMSNKSIKKWKKFLNETSVITIDNKSITSRSTEAEHKFYLESLHYLISSENGISLIFNNSSIYLLIIKNRFISDQEYEEFKYELFNNCKQFEYKYISI